MTISTEQMISVNVGSVANDGTGDDLRTAMIKINNNFSNIEVIGFATGNIEVGGAIEVAGNITVDGHLQVGANIVATGNVIAAKFVGDGSALTGITGTYGNTQVQAYINSYLPTYLPTYSGNLTSVGNVTPSSFQPLNPVVEGWFSNAIGYTSFSTVTQGSSKATAVSLNFPSGNIVLNGAALAAGANVGFQFQNSYISSQDVLIVNIARSATGGAYRVNVDAVANGSANIRLYNNWGASLSEAVVLNYAVIKVGKFY
jgi:hypothetical protein